MAQFTIEIADEAVEEVVGAICNQYGYDPDNLPMELAAVEGGVSPYQFANWRVRKYIQELVIAERIKQAQATAAADALAAASPSISDPISPTITL